MSDPMYVWGDPRICSSMVLTLIATLFVIMSVIFYQEQTEQLHFFRWFMSYRNNNIKYKLNKRQYNRLYRRTILFVYYFVKPGSLFLVLSFEYIVIHSTYLAYTDPNTNYSLIGSMFSLLLLTLVIVQGAGVTLSLLLVYYFLIEIIIMKFNEVNCKFNRYLNDYKPNNSYQLALLVSIMHEHSYLSNMTKQVNVTVKWVLFVIYYIATPTLQISIYCVHHRANSSDMQNILCNHSDSHISDSLNTSDIEHMGLHCRRTNPINNLKHLWPKMLTTKYR